MEKKHTLCGPAFFHVSYLYLLHMCCSTPSPPSAKLTPLWSLKADCFLIGVVLEVLVVMVTCEGHLEGLGTGGLGQGGRGQPLKKTEASFYPRLRGSLQKKDCMCKCAPAHVQTLCGERTCLYHQHTVGGSQVNDRMG